MKALVAAALIATALLGHLNAAAQNYPSRPIVVVAHSPTPSSVRIAASSNGEG